MKVVLLGLPARGFADPGGDHVMLLRVPCGVAYKAIIDGSRPYATARHNGRKQRSQRNVLNDGE